MQKRVILLIFAFIGIGFGLGAMPALWDLLNMSGIAWLNNPLVDGLIGVVIFLALAELAAGWIMARLKQAETFF